LAENIDALGEALDLEFSDIRVEQRVGDFKVDLTADVGNGRLAVIENQLEETNHDHLGKLVTYLTNLQANTGIWITSAPRDEHVRALNWLNEFGPDDVSFFLVKVEAVRVDDSPPAPQFSVVAGPNEQARAVGKSKKKVARRHVVRKQFWAQLLERAKGRPHPHAAVAANEWERLSAGAGRTGFEWRYEIREHHAFVSLYLDARKAEENKHFFDAVARNKRKIEKEVGTQMEWARMPDNRASKISIRIEGGWKDPESKWPNVQRRMIERMVRMHRVFSPLIERFS
jgi:hypothetical protein